MTFVVTILILAEREEKEGKREGNSEWERRGNENSCLYFLLLEGNNHVEWISG